MTSQVAILLVIILIALILFSFEWIQADIVGLGVLTALILTGLLTPGEAFAGFGSDTFLMIFGLLILTAALVRTGVVELAGRAFLQRTGENPARLLRMAMVTPALLSSLMSNTAATAFFLPIILGLSRKVHVSAAKLLMPLAFATILASSVTLVATSTNLVVSGLMTQYGLDPIGMFELTPVGVPILVMGLLYMGVIGRRLIPVREAGGEGLESFDVHTFVSEAVIRPGSPLAGKTLAQSGLGRDLDLAVLRVERNGSQHLAPQADLELLEGDVLLVEGRRDDILKIKSIAGIDIKADTKLSDPALQDKDVQLVEAVLMPRSRLVNRTLTGLRFRERFGLQVLAVNRHGEMLQHKLSQLILRLGDVLLIQGPRSNIIALQEENAFRVIGSVYEKQPNLRRAPIAIGAFAMALLLTTFDILPFSVAVLLGVLVVFITRCINPEEAYREIEWRALILIGSMLALGIALERTGTADYLAQMVVNRVGHMHPIWLLSGFFILTVMLTQPMSNQAAAVVVLPIALQTAVQLGLNPRSFAMMIAVAASCSFLTPLEPACLMVYGPGRYRFLDFVKVGTPLTVLIYGIAILLVPMLWPL